MIYLVKALNDRQEKALMQFTFYIATLKKEKKNQRRGFFFSFAYFLLFGVCQHQESQFISEIAPKYKHLTI